MTIVGKRKVLRGACLCYRTRGGKKIDFGGFGGVAVDRSVYGD